MDFHELREALRPLGFRPSWLEAPFRLVRWSVADGALGTTVDWTGVPGEAAVQRGIREVYRGTFEEVAQWLSEH